MWIPAVHLAFLDVTKVTQAFIGDGPGGGTYTLKMLSLSKGGTDPKLNVTIIDREGA